MLRRRTDVSTKQQLAQTLQNLHTLAFLARNTKDKLPTSKKAVYSGTRTTRVNILTIAVFDADVAMERAEQYAKLKVFELKVSFELLNFRVQPGDFLVLSNRRSSKRAT